MRWTAAGILEAEKHIVQGPRLPLPRPHRRRDSATGSLSPVTAMLAGRHCRDFPEQASRGDEGNVCVVRAAADMRSRSFYRRAATAGTAITSESAIREPTALSQVRPMVWRTWATSAMKAIGITTERMSTAIRGIWRL
jgi:hypothetical protein